MNKQQLLAQREYFNLVHGVTMRAIGTLSNAELGFRPQPGMRTPRELVFHIYSQERALAEAARQGRFTPEAAERTNPESPVAAAEVAALGTVGEVQRFAEACHQAAGEVIAAMTDQDVARPVESPFGTYPAWRCLAFAYDEHWHHRGQLYTYLRLLGKEPPMLYDYGGGEA
jgi:uncharacterized damage-inducible protein DinB